MRLTVVGMGLFFSGLVWLSSAFAAAPLPVEEVFQLSAQRVNTQQVMLNWQIAPGYYLYRDRFKFHCQPVACTSQLPPAKQITDAAVGNYAVYEQHLTFSLHLPAHVTQVDVIFQGCSSEGFCYPPVSKTIHVKTSATDPLQITDKHVDMLPAKKTTEDASALFSSERSFVFILVTFFGLGLLLGFTPCVFPMIPILASIIVGHAHRVSRWRAFKLALTYVFSSAMTYAAAGIAVGWAGSYVQAIFQQPWVLVSASIMLVLLAFSLFGFYELQLPATLRNHLSHHSHRQQRGTYVGVAIMGCLATLIVSPCVSAPLVGALGYIGSTGDMFLGGSALFMLGLGMGLPLLTILTIGNSYLPKAGRWMHAIRALCGGLLLIVAVSLLVRVYPEPINWLFPSARTNGQLAFKTVKNISDLEQALLEAKQQGKPVMLDFYADWCITCKKLEKYTFNNARIVPVLKKMVLLRADVTANNADDKALQQHLKVFAPPTIILFDAHGNEIADKRIVGDISAAELLKKLPA